ncbi:PAS domain-containing protein [Microvirga sp. BT350]|uniref:histidine kinase n=1 Tax=Microvirga alba TaxID=2791025 RepID=A0A931BPB2_9HYPH|nr:PAS domain-containing protein [Microvirga alba]
MLSPDFTIVEMNDAYLRAAMRQRDDIIGRNIFEAFASPPGESGEANVAKLRISLNRVLEHREPDHIPLLHYDILLPEGGFGERFWSVTNTPLLNEAGEVAFILQYPVDVTELHRLRQASFLHARGVSGMIEGDILKRAQAVQQANEELQEERQLLRSVFEQAPGFVAVLGGPDHVFELANKAYSQIIGDRDILGKSVREALPEIVSQGFIPILDQVYASGQPYVGHGIRASFKRKPSEPLVEGFFDIVFQPVFDADGSTVGIFVQGNDITEQKRAEDELRDYREHLEKLVQERTRALEQSEAQRRQAHRMEAIGQLTGGVAHDFNNLLAIVIGNLELAQKRIADPRVDHLLENALQAGERGAKLIRQLLAFARKQSLSLESTDLPQVIGGMRDLLSRTIGPNIAIETDLASELWPVVTDRTQLEVALLNLAINARDAMPAGGKLTIAARNVAGHDLPRDLAIGEYVRISVRDTGIGIPEEFHGKVFEPFFTTKDVGKGTGLGLSQIYGFVKQQGGSITLYSEAGRGTEIALYLPRTQAAPRSGTSQESLAELDGSGIHLLVVDDDAGVRAFVVESLRNFGFQVSHAESGDKGLSMLRLHDDIALIVADFAMPSLDGLGFIQAARARRPDIPVVLMTGYADAERLTDAHLKNVPLVLKPFSLETLIKTLRESLGHRLSLIAPEGPAS